ncbi:hypothetical protein TEK04_06265 [Klenkia sp. LSe6-5]|uniref:Uncharacterized protein n=1 Tax=Klenkia sesuvii TaxID=3103137 RepID=A0ABU8DSB5_9ACTN
MTDPFDIPEADRLEQDQPADPRQPQQPPVPAGVDAGEADPADVLDQHLDVPEDDDVAR